MIMVVEDEMISRKQLSHQLQNWGFHVIEADSGETAMTLFRENTVEMIITDQMMPGLSGSELCRSVREYGNSYYTYIIILTSLEKKENIIEGIEAGADDYMTKPYDQNELRVRIMAGERILRLERMLAQKNSIMQSELESSAKVLRNLLPKKGIYNDKIRVNWKFEPSIYIGGDIFNVFQLSEHKLGFYLIDVSGHGVSAALFAVTLSNLLRPLPGMNSLVQQTDTNLGLHISDPHAIVEHLSKRFPLRDSHDLYFTIFYGVIDTDNLLLRYVRAGQPGPVIINNSEIRTLDHGDPPVGILDDYSYTTFEEQLNSGDKILLYSDGVTEAAPAGDDANMFGQNRLKEYCKEMQDSDSETFLRELIVRVENFSGSKQFEDDFTMLMLDII